MSDASNLVAAGTVNSQYRYRAFISYSHTDTKWAKRLQGGLERYRVPRRLRGRVTESGIVPKSLYPLFRDRDELPAAADLSDVIQDALRSSQFLIVICSPRAAVSRWVNAEVRYFQELGRTKRVLCVITDGEPHAAERPESGLLECFPPSIRAPLGDAAVPPGTVNPMAVDIRQSKDSFADARLKLIAGVLDIPYSELKDRDRHRVRLRWAWSSVSAALLIGLFGFILRFGLNNSRDSSAKTLATQAGEMVMVDPNRALSVAVTSVERSPQPENVRILSDILQQQRLVAILHHQEAVSKVEFSRGDSLLATVSGKRCLIWAVNDLHLVATLSHDQDITEVHFSPDGTRVLTTSVDATARLWDKNGRLLFTFGRHSGTVSKGLFSPDGRRAVTISDRGSARVWDTLSGAQILTLQESNSVDAAVYGVAYSGDGTTIALSGVGWIRLFDSSGRKFAEVRKQSVGRILHLVFAPDSRQLVSIGDDKDARLWAIPTCELLHTLVGHGDRIEDAVFLSNGRQLLTASLDETVRLWNLKTGREERIFRGHTDVVLRVLLSPKSDFILTAGSDQTPLIWSLNDSAPPIALRGHTAVVGDAALSSDGLLIATASDDATVRLWRSQSSRPSVVLTGHHGAINDCAWFSDGQHVTTGGEDGTIRLWDRKTGACLRVLPAHDGPIRTIRISPDGNSLLTASADKTAKMFDAATGRLLQVFAGHTSKVNTAEYSHDGSLVLTASADSTARLWDAKTGKGSVIYAGHTASLLEAIFSSDDRRVLTAGFDNAARLWDTRSGNQIARTAGDFPAPINRLKFVTNSLFVTNGAGFFSVFRWNSLDNSYLEFKGHHGFVRDLDICSDKYRLISGSDDKTVRVWDLRTGTTARVLEGHGASVGFVRFSNTCKEILSGSDDRTVRVWNADTGAIVDVLGEGLDAANTAAFDRSGSYILTAGNAGRAYVYAMDSQELLRLGRQRLAVERYAHRE